MQSVDPSSITSALETFTAKGPNGATMRLDAIADFDWEDVVLLPSNITIEQMRTLAGSDLSIDDELVAKLTSDSKLLVFRHGGSVAQKFVVSPPVFLSGDAGSTYTRDDAVLVVHTKDPGPYSSLRFQN